MTKAFLSFSSPMGNFAPGTVGQWSDGRSRYVVYDPGNLPEVHTFPDAPHRFWFFDPWFEPTMQYMAAFLKKVFHYQRSGG